MDPAYPTPGGPTFSNGPCAKPPSPRRRWLVWGCLSCIALLGVLVIGFGVYIEWAWVAEPPTPGNQVPARVKRRIRNLGLLQPGEEILYLYSDGMFRVEDELSFFTQRRLVLHSEEWEEPTIAVNLLDIESITPTFAESVLDTSYLDVTFKDGTELTVTLGNGRGGDKKYYNALKRAWEMELARQSTAPSDGK